jgi:citrate synthase
MKSELRHPEDSLRALVARALEVDVTLVTDDLEFSSIAQWDSLGHVDLMLALEGEYGVSISDELTVELISYRAIRTFVEALMNAAEAPRDVA